jgi:3'-phosphoadenosine 5'-phosphosulfate sulfotransferase (PAPS reductase)/FAD synthetase
MENTIENIVKPTNKVEWWVLKQRQALPLEIKIKMTQHRIKEYYDYFGGDVIVSFSGGKDSTVLLHIARSMYPDIKGFFIDSSVEYPEVRRFAHQQKNILFIKPQERFQDIIIEYGFPIISKEVAQKIYELRTSKSEKLKNIRLYGKGKARVGQLAWKYHYLVDAPFKISDRCCYFLRKKPSRSIEKSYCKITGEMAGESILRKTSYIKYGCTSFTGRKIFCKPMSFWTEPDIWDYINKYSLDYSDIYKMGYQRTGCMFCMFGVHLEAEPNRFQLMKQTHPKLWEYAIFKLNLKEPLDFIKVPYE